MVWQADVLDPVQHVGVVSEPRVIEVERGFLKLFAKATGERNPIHFDQDAARAAGYRDVVAPPTYLFSLHMGAPAKRGDLFDAENGIGVDISKLLHAEQSMDLVQPIYGGDRLTLTTTTSEIYEKKGGALEFIVQETEGRNEAGEVCARMRNVMVLRHG